jgi:hypothetical protein
VALLHFTHHCHRMSRLLRPDPSPLRAPSLPDTTSHASSSPRNPHSPPAQDQPGALCGLVVQQVAAKGLEALEQRLPDATSRCLWARAGVAALRAASRTAGFGAFAARRVLSLRRIQGVGGQCRSGTSDRGTPGLARDSFRAACMGRGRRRPCSMQRRVGTSRPCRQRARRRGRAVPSKTHSSSTRRSVKLRSRRIQRPTTRVAGLGRKQPVSQPLFIHLFFS